jgi:tryptophan synthase alpha subunit
LYICASAHDSFVCFLIVPFEASATRALAKGITYYNPILKRGIPNFMSIVKEAGVHGNVSL